MSFMDNPSKQMSVSKHPKELGWSREHFWKGWINKEIHQKYISEKLVDFFVLIQERGCEKPVRCVFFFCLVWKENS